MANASRLSAGSGAQGMRFGSHIRSRSWLRRRTSRQAGKSSVTSGRRVTRRPCSIRRTLVARREELPERTEEELDVGRPRRVAHAADAPDGAGVGTDAAADLDAPSVEQGA